MNTNPQPELLTLLPKQVINVQDAEAVLLALAQCNKLHHFDDDPNDVPCFSPEEADAVELLMGQMDVVTRKHYGMEQDTAPNAAIWEGLVKDVTCGFLAFGGADSGDRLYVYDFMGKLSSTSLSDWKKLKAKATEDDGASYDERVIRECLGHLASEAQ